MKKIIFSLFCLLGAVSMNAQIVKVYNNGSLVTTYTNGNGNNYRFVAQEIPDVSVSSVTFSNTTASVNVGNTITLTASILPSDASDKTLTWSSDDESVATVTSAGVVKGVSPGLAIIKAMANDGSGKYARCAVTVSAKPADAHEYVDLGLPSGTLWATCNVGATSPEDYGLYFAWGETTGYTSDTSDGRSFDWANYKWMKAGQSLWTGCTKYTFADGQTSGCWYSNGTYVGTTVDGTTYTNLTELESADDAATVNWGSKWCMPTHEQQQELVNSSYTSTEWTKVNGVYGRKITSLSNGNSLFLPATGSRGYSSLSLEGSYGNYWSSELGSNYSNYAWLLDFSSSDVSASEGSIRYYGRSVRAVRSASQN